MAEVDQGFWRGKRVLLTGHTGFKGSWAALWLSRMGAEVTGIALPADTEPNLYALAGVGRDVRSKLFDIRDGDALAGAIRDCKPQIVLHMAAQSLVRRAARDPVETAAINVMGTVNLLQQLRDNGDLEAILVVTTDKVYRNDEGRKAFTEDDVLGGHEPYAASKAAADILSRAFGDSYFETRGIPVATARGGNVLGGGDFADDRLVPDIVRAILAHAPVILRNPNATRPWQHVLDCVAGYFLYLQALTERRDVPRALNFSPLHPSRRTVAQIADAVIAAMGDATAWVQDNNEARPHESHFLSVDAGLANRSLFWSERYYGDRIVDVTAAWYREFGFGRDMRALTLSQIDDFTKLASSKPRWDRVATDPAATAR